MNLKKITSILLLIITGIVISGAGCCCKKDSCSVNQSNKGNCEKNYCPLNKCDKENYSKVVILEDTPVIEVNQEKVENAEAEEDLK